MKTKFRGIKTAAEYRRGELVPDILRLIGRGVVVTAAAVVAPNTFQLLEYFNPHSRAERNKIWNAIHYLEKHGDVEVRTDPDGKQYLHLTRQGKIRFGGKRIWDITLSTPAKWNHKWHLVMFDFPVKCRARHAFREKLQDFGFQMYQRSVFIYPHECREEVYAVAKWFEVEDYIRYIVATEIKDMRHFVKSFDLL